MFLTHDDIQDGLLGMGIAQGRWQILFSIPALIGVLNSVLPGVLLGLVVAWATPRPVAGAVQIGFVAGSVSARLHYRFIMRTMSPLPAHIMPLFPTPRPMTSDLRARTVCELTSSRRESLFPMYGGEKELGSTVICGLPVCVPADPGHHVAVRGEHNEHFTG
jgi:hypothetical protein